MPSLNQIERYESACRRLALARPVTTVKENFGMRPTLKDDEIWALDKMMKDVKLHVILDFIAASTFEAADQCEGEDRDSLMQQAANVSGAALFCKTWDPNK